MPELKEKPQKSVLKSVAGKQKPVEALWKGPEDTGKQGGISQSMISNFLCCRERFRVKYILGLRPPERFNHYIEYGNMWHLCEELHAVGKPWETPLLDMAKNLAKTYRDDQILVNKWYNCCRVQFPIYAKYWEKHDDVKKRIPIIQEGVFNVPYTLGSGRVVILRGKWDSADIIDKGIWLQENKTKSEIDEAALRRQLTFDMQTMLYLVALEAERLRIIAENDDSNKEFHKHAKLPLRGVRYNVIRRPLSGGKGNIKQKEIAGKMETEKEYYTRLQQYFIDEPQEWFVRWKVGISEREVQEFKLRFLNPILEQICQWYDSASHWMGEGQPDKIWEDWEAGHYQHPYGVRNMIDEGGTTDYDRYLATGVRTGLEQSSRLFSELG